MSDDGKRTEQQRKADKRAAALRENLKRRKAADTDKDNDKSESKENEHK